MSHGVDNDECYDVYDETCRRARKEHVCDACCEPIRRGDLYHVVTGVWDHSARSWKRCVRCQEIHVHLRTLAPGETWPDERLGCGTEYRAEWGRDPPPEIVALAFMSADEMQARAEAQRAARSMPKEGA